ncbi:hypothetical protein SIAM614_22042 [Stappia aggregata IAM 12614]|uniref:Uncharacterized protein n=1 Tax=Roseibium aggregatum (strain ATCC 25650 / DSM 13394 / JCM 20685 / NBRC 16684 / NCIMB 2208 / IAM 12614 / B1) TaxID=384765 RepID=A0NXW4_ROSAI|nr:hypothetical protein SIAM614_22042 [Stappia aggregata IAM 12614] [Roseibium aggregatum IAM 12614]
MPFRLHLSAHTLDVTLLYASRFQHCFSIGQTLETQERHKAQETQPRIHETEKRIQLLFLKGFQNIFSIRAKKGIFVRNMEPTDG